MIRDACQGKGSFVKRFDVQILLQVFPPETMHRQRVRHGKVPLILGRCSAKIFLPLPSLRQTSSQGPLGRASNTSHRRMNMPLRVGKLSLATAQAEKVCNLLGDLE